MNTVLRTFTITLAVSLTLCVSSSSIAGEIVVITHPSVGIDHLSKEEVMRIFLAKSKTYPNEKPAVPVIHKESTDIRKKFESVVFEKTPMQIKAYWTRLLFTGRGNPPQTLDTDEAIRKKVAETPNSIGYIDNVALDQSVHVVFTIK